MPQMAPISWLILFFIFSCAFLMFNILNYFCKTPNMMKYSIMNNNNINNNVLKTNNWKW